MSTINWGMLAKSQVDPETIEEAIARLIVEHNDDETAHLSAGQSLSSHKAAEIIDHLVASVLADKLSATEGIFETSFDSIDAWYKIGACELISWADFNIYADNAPTAHSQAYIINPYALSSFDLSKDFLFQTVLYIAKDSVSKVNFGIGYFGSDPTGTGAGFYWNGTNFKAYVRISSTNYLSDALTINYAKPHVFRILNEAVNKTLKFYIDGVLVWSYIYASSATIFSDFIFYDVFLSTDGEVYVEVHKMSISRALN